MSDFIAYSDAIAVRGLARIIRDGDDTETNRAYDGVIATHGRDVGISLWDEAIRQVDREQAERENTEGGTS